MVILPKFTGILHVFKLLKPSNLNYFERHIVLQRKTQGKHLLYMWNIFLGSPTFFWFNYHYLFISFLCKFHIWVIVWQCQCFSRNKNYVSICSLSGRHTCTASMGFSYMYFWKSSISTNSPLILHFQNNFLQIILSQVTYQWAVSLLFQVLEMNLRTETELFILCKGVTFVFNRILLKKKKLYSYY